MCHREHWPVRVLRCDHRLHTSPHTSEQVWPALCTVCCLLHTFTLLSFYTSRSRSPYPTSLIMHTKKDPIWGLDPGDAASWSHCLLAAGEERDISCWMFCLLLFYNPIFFLMRNFWNLLLDSQDHTVSTVSIWNTITRRKRSSVGSLRELGHAALFKKKVTRVT